MLADGVGGGNASETAAALALSTVLEVAVRASSTVAADGHSVSCSATAIALRTAGESADATIRRQAPIRTTYAGVGTTLVAAWFHDDRVAIAHVGDSRLYRLRSGTLGRRTRDHSLLESRRARGEAEPSARERRAYGHIITRAGHRRIGEATPVELAEERVEARDLFLLCSDGLSDMHRRCADQCNADGRIEPGGSITAADRARQCGGRQRQHLVDRDPGQRAADATSSLAAGGALRQRRRCMAAACGASR